MTGDRALSFILFATSLILAVAYTPVRDELRAVVAFVTSDRIAANAHADRAKPGSQAAAATIKMSSGVQDGE